MIYAIAGVVLILAAVIYILATPKRICRYWQLINIRTKEKRRV